jgi:hypothetical protein
MMAMTGDTKQLKQLKQQMLQKFNLNVSKLINNIRGLVAVNKQTSSDYCTFETVVNNILMPFNQEILIKTYRRIICGGGYSAYIKKRDDSLFSNNGIYEEYKNIYNIALDQNNSASTQVIANFIAKQLEEHHKKEPSTKQSKWVPLISNISDKNGEVNLKKIDCDEIMSENKTEITEAIKKYRARWDSLSGDKKKEIWDILNIMNYLAEKYPEDPQSPQTPSAKQK